jgi:ureidoglycolate lyase
MQLQRHTLPIEALTAQAFAPFGDVIETRDSAQHFTINQGYAERYHNLAKVDAALKDGYPIISIFKAKPRSLPMQVQLLERHPLGSQAFIALSSQPFLVVVAPAGDVPQFSAIRCFQAAAGQGVNYARGTWHHPLIALHSACDFLVVDRDSSSGDANCDEYALQDASVWIA